MGTSGSGSTGDVSDEITADTLGLASGTKIVTATSKDTSVAEVTDVVKESADVAADAVNIGQVAVSANASAGTYIKSFKITAVGEGSTYIDVKITDTATSEESHKYIPVKVSSDKKLKSKTAAAIKSEVTDKNPDENEGGTTYKVTVETTENGTVTAKPSAGVAEGTEVTLEIKPETGYALDKLSVGEDDRTADVAEGKYTFKMPAGNVKVSATFKAARLGSKASPDAVGDIVFKDGSAEPYTADLTDAQKQAAIAVIFDATKKLGVGLVQGTGKMWAQNDTTGYNTSITTLLATKTSGSNASDAEFSGDGASDGSGNLAKFRTAVGVSSGALSSADYPAWAWIEGYAATANLTGTSYESGWYMPSIKELCDLYNAKDAVNNSIEKTGGTQMSTGFFWSSSQTAFGSGYAWSVKFGSGALGTSLKYGTNSVCAFRAFN